ncbi:MAG: hypothetical protein K6T78_11245 [Alicyclobacillus sp.]|nr:hypothetical protein [Alicyclobacillus sp.]
MHRPSKIVLIGAGSAVFTQGLLADFILATDLHPLEIDLVDVDEEVLGAISSVAQKMVDSRPCDIKISASTDRREVLPGADVVVTTVAVGGRRAWETDVFIPRQYGIYQPVGDTTMPGGISRALRMIPVMMEIAQDVAELCPQAYFFNYSNPMTAICTAILRETGVDVTGLCHGVLQAVEHLAKFIGEDPSDARAIGVGINHLTFLYDFRVSGRDAWGKVNEVLAWQRRNMPMPAKVTDFFSSMGRYNPARPVYYDNLFSWELYEQLGAFPAVLDRHVVEFFPERFAGGAYYGRVLGKDAYSFENVVAWGDRDHADLLLRAGGEKDLNEQSFHRSSGEHEQLVDILRSLYQDERKVFSVNRQNQGAVPNLPQDAVLEMPAVAAGRGFYPLFLADFPDQLVPILERRIQVVDLTVEAARTGDRGLVVQALLADGSVTSRETAELLADDLLRAHREYLPRFFR